MNISSLNGRAMSRPLVIIVVLTLIISDFQIGKINGFFCKQIADLANAFYFVNKQVDFYVHTSSHVRPYKVSCLDSCDFKDVQFNPNLRTTIIIHGFLSNHETYWIQYLVEQLFTWQEMNIIVVDWSEFFNINYYQSAMRVPNVAIEIHKFLEGIAEISGKDLRDLPYLHLIGHSLGAHVAGITANILKNKMFVHRITALDPAKPYFDDVGAQWKLNKSAAQFVDVIHTNSSPNEETFGFFEALGHVDFYVNGGDKQPDCSSGKVRKRFVDPIKCLSEIIFGVNLVPLKKNYLWRILLGNSMICDHASAQKYFIETINNQAKFVAKKIDIEAGYASTDCTLDSCNEREGSCIKMGMHSTLYNDSKYHGVYYVNTKCKTMTYEYRQ